MYPVEKSPDIFVGIDAFIQGKKPFSNQKPCDGICDVVLLGGLGRDHDKKRKNTRKPTIPAGNFFIAPYADIAHPAHQTVNGWKQVSGLVNGIQEAKQRVGKGVSHNFGTYIRGWHQEKKDTTYDP